MTVLVLLVVLLASLALTAFCAGAETGFISLRRERVLHMAREGGARAKVLYGAISDLGRTTTALLVGNNLASVTYSSAATALMISLCPDAPAVRFAASLFVALVLLLLGEFLPKLLCAARPLRRMLQLAPAWKAFARVFVPVGSLMQLAVERLMPRREARPRVTPETVLRILADRNDGVKLSDFERVLVKRILTLRSRGEFIVPDALLRALDEIYC